MRFQFCKKNMQRTHGKAGITRRGLGMAAVGTGMAWRPARAQTGADVAKAKTEGAVML
jgi:hypothetical protein